MRDSRRFWAPILPLWLALAGCQTSAAKGEPQNLLAAGKSHYAKKEYRQAARHFRGVDRYHPESDEAEEALFMLAESDRQRGKGQLSFGYYKEFVEKFPNSRFAVGAAIGEFKLGTAHFDGEIPGFFIFGADKGYGVDILEHMHLHYRNHSLADDALMRVADWHLKQRNYEDAVDTLKRLLAEYPRSEHMLWSRFQLARTLWLLNQGALYDERLLLQSKRAFEDYIGTAKILRRTEEQGDRIQLAEQMLEKIRERRAEKDYLVGRFYERRGHPKSAVYYYRHCVRAFPGTEHAGKAQGRIERLGGKKSS